MGVFGSVGGLDPEIEILVKEVKNDLPTKKKGFKYESLHLQWFKS